MTEKKTDEQRANEHWEYIREVVRDGRDERMFIHMTVGDYLDRLGHHYTTAMVHGMKHIRELFAAFLEEEAKTR